MTSSVRESKGLFSEGHTDHMLSPTSIAPSASGRSIMSMVNGGDNPALGLGS